MSLATLIERGVFAGGQYALLALGLVLIFRVSRVVNFAHGSIAMFSTYVAQQIMAAGFGLMSSVVSGLFTGAGLGLLVQRLVVEGSPRSGPRGEESVVLGMLGVLIVLEGMAFALWGASIQVSRVSRSLFGTMTFMGQHALPRWHMLAFVAVVVLMAVPLRWTRLGLALRAIYDDRTAAALFGVRVRVLEALVWAAAGMLAAASGILLSDAFALSPSMMFAPLLKAFAAAVVGGMVSMTGAVLAGVGLGVVETLVGAYVSTALAPAVTFVAIIVALAVRPFGLRRDPGIGRI